MTNGGIEPDIVQLGVFNCVRIVSPGGKIHIVGRVSTGKNYEHRGVDPSKLIVFTPQGRAYDFIPPNMPPGIKQIEDPRECDGAMGVTVVHDKRQPDNSIRTSAGLIETGYDQYGRLIPKSIRVLTNPDRSSLRNITPIAVKRNGEITEVDFLARIEDGRHDRILSRFTSDGDIARHVGDIFVPIKDWNSKKVGTVGKPLSLGGGLELLFVHGQRVIDLEKDRREYSLGAIILRGNQVISTTQEPFLRRHQSSVRGELHKETLSLFH